ncbi:MAG TPA: PH domain-containing protein [Mycobacteriales bacterium]|nr:PH domain-containing protein [Mycobacteriales bacterium]
MPFPQRLLADDEAVVLDLHPHWKQLVGPLLLLPVVVGLATYLTFLVPGGSAQAPLRWAIVGVAVLVLLRFTLWPFLRWQTTRYVLTNRRVVIRTGVFGRSGRDIPLTRVNDVSFQHSLFERMLRCGTLTIESAGENGQVVLPEVPKVELVQREVYRVVEAEVRRQGGAWREPAAGA